MKASNLILIAGAPLAFVSCDNPADRTTDAQVREAVEKVTVSDSNGIKYVFTDNSRIGFTGSKVTGSHDGGFKKFTGHFHIADGKPVGNDHKVVIDMDSTWSDDDKLTGHLKSEDFFDVGEFPESTFDVTAIEPSGGGKWQVSGNFTLHGVTRNITFPATVSHSGELAKIAAEFDIKRKDFGIVFPGMPDDLIKNEVIIRLELEAGPEA